MKIVFMVENDDDCFRREGTLPFFPAKDMMLSLKGDDSREVESVWWDESKPDELLVWFEDCTYMSTETMLSSGWEIDKP